MKFLFYPILLSSITFLMIVLILSGKADGGGMAAPFYLLVFVTVGFVVGLIVSLVRIKWPRFGTGIAVLYGGFWLIFGLYSFFIDGVIKDCERDSSYEFNRTQDINLLDKWCIRESHKGVYTQKAVDLGDKGLFDAILARGVDHPDPDCAYLIIAIRSNDVNEVGMLLSQGVSASCRIYGRTPISTYEMKKRRQDTDDKTLKAMHLLLTNEGGDI